MYIIFIINLFFIFYIYKYYFNIKCRNISHACGIFQSIKYTNSLQAFYNSYSKGYRYIEIDLLETYDKHIVGAHDWSTFKFLTNYKSNEVLNITYLHNAKIMYKYDLIYDNMIYRLLKYYSDVYIFTDKITNYNLLKINSIKINRLCVEVFTYKQYYDAKSYGFGCVMLNIRSKNDLETLLKTLSKNKTINAITIKPIIFYTYKKILLYLFKQNIKIYSYEVYNLSDIKSAFCKYVTGFYLD